MHTLEAFLEFARDETAHPRVEMVDLRFADVSGAWHHVTIPLDRFDEQVLTRGVPFDGSSLGFKTVSSGDMALLPDLATALYDPFGGQGTIGIICNVVEADTSERFANDPRWVAERAEKLLAEEGIADGSLWGPEFEFYIFDKIVYVNDINVSYYRIDSEEADWNTGAEEGRNLGGKIPHHAGYHAMPPLDRHYGVRNEMAMRIGQAGIPVRYHHHEVGGPGQSEIEIGLLPLLKAADATLLIKYLTKMVAREANKTVTYMPKPLFNEAGSGMHFHQLLVRGDKSLFWAEGEYANLSKLARHYIGGLLVHGRALLAFTNPSTNSYKRLVPGFEAPVSLSYGLANRSATVRIPKYVANDREQRIEFRPPDGTCNPYLAMAAQLMAGIDGIVNGFDAAELGYGPYDVNIYELPPEEQAKIKTIPTSLKEAMLALREDHAFLLRGGVFTEELIEVWVAAKMKRYEEVRNRPHPYEMTLYFDV
jgi:glutamine synthetase